MSPTSEHDSWGGLQLTAGPNRGEFRAVEAGAAVAAGRVLYALDGEGCRHLLVPVSEAVVVAPDRRSAGVHIVPHQLVENDVTATFIDVACRRPLLNDVFAYLADEIVSELVADPGDPQRTCRRILSKWREFIDRELTIVLSTELLAGLYGELWHLRELIRRAPSGLDAWVGPLGRPHDFLRGTTALEVKTTLRREGWLFEIHGIEQLEPPESGTLHAAVMRLEQSAVGESVPALLDQMRQLGTDMHELFAKLAKVGYDGRYAEHYGSQAFRVHETSVYVVDKDFPRIVRASFRSGALPVRVSGLRYYIDLAGCPPTPVDAAAVARVYDVLAAAVPRC